MFDGEVLVLGDVVRQLRVVRVLPLHLGRQFVAGVVEHTCSAIAYARLRYLWFDYGRLLRFGGDC